MRVSPQRQAPQSVLQGAIDDSDTQPLQQFALPSGAALSYEADALPFFFRVRKEVFTPNETLDNPVAVDLVFQQIVADVTTHRDLHPRISEKEHGEMKALFESKGIIAGSKSTSKQEKMEIIDIAKRWTHYFGRRYKVDVIDGADAVDANVAHYLTIGHQGVQFSKVERVLVAQTGAWKHETTGLIKLTFNDVDLDSMKSKVPGQIKLTPPKADTVVLSTPNAKSILMLIEAYLLERRDDARFVLSVKPYQVRDATLLAFPANVVIALGNTRQIEKGWLYGTYDGKTGTFPVDYVSPIIGAPTETSVAIARRQSVKRWGSVKGNRRDHAVVDGVVQKSETTEAEVKVTSRMAHTRELTSAGMAAGPGMTIRGKVAPAVVEDEILPSGKFSTMVFAKEHFRQGQERYEMMRTETGSIRGTIALRQEG